MTRVLGERQLEQWHRDGYLVLADFFGRETASQLKRHAQDLLADFSMDHHPMTRFTTGGGGGDNDEHVGDDYFLQSGDKIRFFFEPEAVREGRLVVPKERAINKIGHALHDLDPVFRDFSQAPRVTQVVRELGAHVDPRMVQSMIICKQPGIGGQVGVHQDSPFLYTDPPSAVGLWFALEDCTRENGCLHFAKGTHLTHPIRERFVRKQGGGGGTEFVKLGERAAGSPEPPTFTMEECAAGTLVLIHGSVLHKSEVNRSNKSRFIYTFHVIDGERTYDERNWLQSSKPFTKVGVAPP